MLLFCHMDDSSNSLQLNELRRVSLVKHAAIFSEFWLIAVLSKWKTSMRSPLSTVDFQSVARSLLL